MSTADSLTPSLTRKLVITTTLALLALAYTRPVRSLEQGIGDRPVACSPGDEPTTNIAPVTVPSPAHATERVRLHRVAPMQVSMHTSFDPASRLVKVALQPKDSANTFIANLRPSVARQFLAEMRPGDRVAVWSYDDKLHEVVGFSRQREAMLDAFQKIDGALPLVHARVRPRPARRLR